MSVLPNHVARSLCSTCKNCRVIVSGKGSIFLMCREPSMPKYPRQPVAGCTLYMPKPKDVEKEKSDSEDDDASA